LETFLPPHGAKFYPFEAEVVRDDRAGVIEIRRNFIVDDGDAEGRFETRRKQRNGQCACDGGGAGCFEKSATGEGVTSLLLRSDLLSVRLG
jgi:hypothetical protein